jgi:hypothetical protein
MELEPVDRTMNGVPDMDTGRIDTPATLRSGIVDSSFAAEDMLTQSVCEGDQADNILEEDKQANVRRHSSPDEKKDPKVLWAKALWWATQEVRRRKLTELHLAPGSNNSKGEKLWGAVKSVQRGLGEIRRSSLAAVKVSSFSLNAVAPSDPSAQSEESPCENERTPNSLKKSTTFISAARLWRISTGRDERPGSPSRDLEKGFVSPRILSDRPIQGSWRRRDSVNNLVRSSSGRRGSVGSLHSSGDSIQSSIESTCDTIESPRMPGKRESHGVSESLHIFHSELKKTPKTRPTEPQTFDERMSRILNGKYYMFFSIACLLWVLGGREIYILGDPPLSSDRPVYCLYLVCLLQLLLDLMLRSPFERNYFLGFYFWLDVSVFSVTCSYECLFCTWKHCQVQARE